MSEPIVELPHGGTVRDLRVQIARLAHRGEAVFERTLLESPPGPLDDATRELNVMAHGASFHGWALASVLGWLEQEHPELAPEAASIVQFIGADGGTEGYCEDITEADLNYGEVHQP